MLGKYVVSEKQEVAENREGVADTIYGIED